MSRVIIALLKTRLSAGSCEGGNARNGSAAKADDRFELEKRSARKLSVDGQLEFFVVWRCIRIIMFRAPNSAPLAEILCAVNTLAAEVCLRQNLWNS